MWLWRSIKCWKTKKGQSKSTNRLDDILQLTESGRHRVQQIHAGNEGDIHVWRWVWFCSGEGNCQRTCDRIEVMLSEVETEFSMHMTIKGNHVPQNIIKEATALSRINLTDKRTTKEIKMKLLASHNGASQYELEHLYNNQNSIYNNIKLRQLIERDNLCARKTVGPWSIIHELVTSVLREKGA
ncbi:24336_t:CDS:2, partial [Racocetra persica]